MIYDTQFKTQFVNINSTHQHRSKLFRGYYWVVSIEYATEYLLIDEEFNDFEGEREKDGADSQDQS